MHCSGNLKLRFEAKTDLKSLPKGSVLSVIGLISTAVLPIGRLEVPSCDIRHGQGQRLVNYIAEPPQRCEFLGMA